MRPYARDARMRLGALLASASLLFAQAPGEHDTTELAKKTQNPVGDIVSVPFQFNFNSGGGLKDETLFNLNFQPVMPIRLGPSVTVIARTIVPINSFPGGDGLRSSGVGDIQEELFFTPAKPGKLIWGIGRRSRFRQRRHSPREPEPGPREAPPWCWPCRDLGSLALSSANCRH